MKIHIPPSRIHVRGAGSSEGAAAPTAPAAPKRRRRLSGGADAMRPPAASAAAPALAPAPASTSAASSSPAAAAAAAAAAPPCVCPQSPSHSAPASPTRSSSPGRKKEAFLVVQEDGTPLPRAAGEAAADAMLMYEASKPSFAAVKAYYAMIRKGGGAGAAAQHPLPAMTDAAAAALRAHVASVAADDERVNAYMAKAAAATADAPIVIRVRRVHETRIHTYRVQYERVHKPNRHEVAKGIVKVAHAVKQ